MHDDVEQEGFYQNCEIYNPQGNSFAPRAGPNMIYSVCLQLNIFNFVINSAPILFKFDIMHLFLPPPRGGAFGTGQKVSKLNNF
jgi:hypothetical protein